MLNRNDSAAPIDPEEFERLRTDGSCRLSIGVWGDKRCPELAVRTHCRNCPVYARTGKRLLDREMPQTTLTVQEAVERSREEATRSVIVFRAGAEWLALPTALAREVVGEPSAHRVPHRNNPRFAGLVNVRGELMPFVDVRVMLGVAEAPAQDARTVSAREHRARALILERDGVAWALRVDDIDDVHRIAETALRPPPVTVELGSPRFTEAMVELPVGQVGVLDADLVLYALGEVCR